MARDHVQVWVLQHDLIGLNSRYPIRLCFNNIKSHDLYSENIYNDKECAKIYCIGIYMEHKKSLKFYLSRYILSMH